MSGYQIVTTESRVNIPKIESLIFNKMKLFYRVEDYLQPSNSIKVKPS